jgi:pimeloyl-ACP methyl ester carboxylesterase
MSKIRAVAQAKPDDFLFHTEGFRSACEMAALPFALPALRNAPRGDGHSVMIIPGFTADDHSTSSLRHYLDALGYKVHGWSLGVNHGVRENLFYSALERIEALCQEDGESITLIGQSLGGIYARELAKVSDHVRQTICLGSPVDARRGNGSRLSALYDLINPRDESIDNDAITRQIAEAPPVPCSMIYSHDDGIVHWQTCMQQEPNIAASENIRVYGSHSGMGFNPAIYYVLANRLSQAEDDWRPFKAPLWLQGLFPGTVH